MFDYFIYTCYSSFDSVFTVFSLYPLRLNLSLNPGGMNEVVEGAFPQIFVVDSQASYSNLPNVRHMRKGRIRQIFQKHLPILVGMALIGVLIEACLIAHLFHKMEKSSYEAPQQNGGFAQQHTSPKESKEIRIKITPSAHLAGASVRGEKANVVHWESQHGETFLREMDYKDDSLVIKKEGHYFMYSKIHFAGNATATCTLLLHKFMKLANGYDKPIELMRSKRYHCRSQGSEDNDNDNSYLGGVFHLFRGDAIYVTLDNKDLLRLGSVDNFMGAFMI